MLLDWIKSPLKKIKDKLLSAVGLVEVGGFSILDVIRKNRDNTKRMKKELILRSIKNKWEPSVLDEELAKLSKQRKTQTLTTYKNIAAAVRGYGRSLLTVGRSGRWYNVTTLDERTTHICLGYVGASWPKPYSAIPEKPPRIQRLVHRCRSFLEFRGKGYEQPASEASFIQQFNAGDDSLKQKLLGPKRYAAYKTGRLPINSYSQFERAVLYTLDDLGLSDQ